MKLIFSIEGEQDREVELEIGSIVIHPDDFETSIVEFLQDDQMLVEDSEGEQYIVDVSEIECLQEDFYAGKIVG